MKENSLDDVLARRFLLGQLSAEEQGRIEELAFDDHRSFAFLKAAEADLIDEFIYDDLSSEEKEQFKKHFLSQPGRRQDLRIARALQRYVAQPETFEHLPTQPADRLGSLSLVHWLRLRTSPRRLSLVAAIVLILVAALGTWLVLRGGRRHVGPPLQAREEHQQQLATPSVTISPTPVENAALPSHRDNQKHPSPKLTTAPAKVIVLIPSTTVRTESSVRRFQLPSSDEVVLELPLIEDHSYSSFQATLEMNGGTVRNWTNLHAKNFRSGKGIVVSLPTVLLELEKDFRIRLNGISPDRQVRHVYNYDFQVYK